MCVLGDCAREAITFLVMGRKTIFDDNSFNLPDKSLPKMIEQSRMKVWKLGRGVGRVVVAKKESWWGDGRQ